MLYLSSKVDKNHKGVSFRLVSWIVLAIFAFFSYFCVIYGYGGGGDFGSESSSGYKMVPPIAPGGNPISADDLFAEGDDPWITVGFAERDSLHNDESHPNGHTGIDIGNDGSGNIVIIAAADGSVEAVDFEEDGAGNYVIIKHEFPDEVVFSGYFHMRDGSIESYGICPGMYVSQGQPIGLMGSSGHSTGDHLHFQVCDSDGFATAIDPCPYLGGQASSSVPTYNPADVGVSYSRKFLTAEQIADFGGEAFRNPVTKIVNACVKAMSMLKDRLLWFFIMLMTIDLCWGGIWGLYKTYYNPNNGGQPGVFMAQVYWIFRRILFYGFIVYFYFHWDDIFINFILGFFTDLGSSAVEADVNEIGMVMSDPSKILQKMLSILSPFFNEMGSYFSSGSVLTFLKNFASAVLSPANFIENIIALILSFVILFIFMLICLNICLAYVEFYIASCFGFTMFCFCGEEHLRRYANHAVNGMFAMGINLFFYCFYVAFIILCMQNMSNVVLHDNNTSAKASAQQQELNLKEFRSSTKTSVDEIMSAIAKCETMGDYINNTDSSTYGAYHINRGKWQQYCDEAASQGVPIDKTIQKDEPNAGQYVWTKSNQDNVMRYLLEKKAKELGNWDAVVQWYRSEGNGFSNKPTGQAYSDSVQKYTFKSPPRVARLGILFCMMILSIFFLILGDRISADLMKLIGSGQGFHFYDSSADSRTV